MYRHEGADPYRPAFFSLRAAKLQNKEPPELFGVLSSNGEQWRNFRKAVQVTCDIKFIFLFIVFNKIEFF